MAEEPSDRARTGNASSGTGTGEGTPHLVVQFAADVGLDQRLAVAQAAGGRPVEDIRTAAMQTAGYGVLTRIALDSLDAVTAAELLAGTPGVVHAAPESAGGVAALALRAGSPSVSNDELYVEGRLWGMYGDTTVPANLFGSQAAEAWAAGITGSTEVAIGVIDSGIDPAHPDLYLNIWLNPREIPLDLAVADTDGDGNVTFRDLNDAANADLVQDGDGNGFVDARDLLADARWANGADEDGNGYADDLYGWDFVNDDNDPFDDLGHGTHVAGIIGALGGNGLGVAGVAWTVQLVALKWLGASNTGSLVDAMEAIDYYTALARSDASLRYAGTNNSWYEFSTAGSPIIRDAIERAAESGILFTTIAGNLGRDNDVTPTFPGSYDASLNGGWDNVIATAAITSSGDLWAESNWGHVSVDLGAPGVGINSTYPLLTANNMAGTSMAAPHVSGAVALLAAAAPELSGEDIKDLILASVAPTSSLQDRVATGGRLDIGALMESLAPRPPVMNEIVGTACDDTLAGTPGDDRIIGVTQGDPTPGRREIDVLTGGEGRDVFVLGDTRGAFYLGTNRPHAREKDYAVITDFEPGDRLELFGGLESYLLHAGRVRKMDGLGLYRDADGDSAWSRRDDLLAVLVGVQELRTEDVILVG